MNLFQNITSTVLTAVGGYNDNWLEDMLAKYIGQDGATAVFNILVSLVNLVVVFVIIQQGIRLAKALEEKNSSDPNERADAVQTAKGAVITIVLAGLLGAVGFNIFITFSGFIFNTAGGN